MPPISFVKPKLRSFQAWLFCVVALGIGSSFSLAAATFSDANWTTVGSGVKNTVHALAVSGSDVYAGGEFTTAGECVARSVAKLSGGSWTALGSGMSNPVYALAVSGSDLYAGGLFTTAGGSTAKYIAKWNGSSWTTLGSGMNGNG